MVNYKLWKQNIYDSIKDISDIEFQRRAWFDQNSDEESSFVEIIGMLYHSFAFNDFLKISNWPNFHLSNGLRKEMIFLKDLIDAYNPTITDYEIIIDPEWLNIVDQAKQVIRLWDIENSKI